MRCVEAKEIHSKWTVVFCVWTFSFFFFFLNEKTERMLKITEIKTLLEKMLCWNSVNIYKSKNLYQGFIHLFSDFDKNTLGLLFFLVFFILFLEKEVSFLM